MRHGDGTARKAIRVEESSASRDVTEPLREPTNTRSRGDRLLLAVGTEGATEVDARVDVLRDKAWEDSRTLKAAASGEGPCPADEHNV